MEFESITDATVSIDKAIAERERIRSEGKTFVLTNGCFDLFHAGHANSLINASKFGDYLWVAINSDESIGRLKGKMRPYHQAVRSILLGSIIRVREWRFRF
jgi:cytidyltransferase-like protein